MPGLALEPGGADGAGVKPSPRRELENVVADGENLAVAPHRRLAPRHQGGGHGRAGRVQMVAGQERLAALGAEVPQPVGFEPLAAEPAFEMGEEACRFHQSR